MRRRGRRLIRWLLSGMAIVSLMTHSWGHDTEGKRKPRAFPRCIQPVSQSAGCSECQDVNVSLLASQETGTQNNNVEQHNIPAKNHEIGAEQRSLQMVLRKMLIVPTLDIPFFSFPYALNRPSVCWGPQNSFTLEKSCVCSAASQRRQCRRATPSRFLDGSNQGFISHWHGDKWKPLVRALPTSPACRMIAFKL